MTAAVAATAALENIANNVEEFLEIPITAKGAAGRAVKAITSVFGDVVDQSLRDQVRWLFGYRNETVHHRADWHAIELHPVLGVPTTRVARFYCSESATRSVQVALDVLSAATKPGRSDNSEAEIWASRLRPLVSELEATRSTS